MIYNSYALDSVSIYPIRKRERSKQTLDNQTIMKIIVGFVPIVIAITFHEVAHGYVAYRLGDNTAKALGRLSLDPLKHVDPVGTVILPIILYATGAPVFGWAKPVPINPMNFKDPRKGMALTAAAGPATNLALAFFSVLILRFGLIPAQGMLSPELTDGLARILYSSAMINIWLAAFNLIPVPPFDGSRVVAGIGTKELANTMDKLEQYGMIIVAILIFSGLYKYLVMPLFKLFYSIIINPILGPVLGG